MGSGGQKDGVTCTAGSARGRQNCRPFCPRQSSPSVFSLPPWLEVKKDAGPTGDTCFPCQLEGGRQTRAGSSQVSCVYWHRLLPTPTPWAHHIPGGCTSLSHPACHGSPILPSVICKPLGAQRIRQMDGLPQHGASRRSQST